MISTGPTGDDKRSSFMPHAGQRVEHLSGRRELGSTHSDPCSLTPAPMKLETRPDHDSYL